MRTVLFSTTFISKISYLLQLQALLFSQIKLHHRYIIYMFPKKLPNHKILEKPWSYTLRRTIAVIYERHQGPNHT